MGGEPAAPPGQTRAAHCLRRRSVRGARRLLTLIKTRDAAMAESIPKAKSAYAFFQAAMNKQMVGVPLG